MARKTSRQILEELLKSERPTIHDAFLDAVIDLVNRVQITDIVEALTRGDWEAALDIIGIEDAAFETVVEAIENTYKKAGRATAAALPMLRSPTGGKVVFRFSARNPQAEAWLEDKSSELITRTVETQREAIRGALRTGLERGQNPKTIALDIAGRVQRGSNRRSGGIIGLTPQQVAWVDGARRQLQTLTPENYRKYKNRVLIDRRFNPTIERALRDGRKLTPAEIEEILGRYSDRILKYGADTIARTETLSALSAAQYETYRQAIESGSVDPRAVSKRWKHSLKEKHRPTHRAAHNTEVLFQEPFIMSDGVLFRYPRDRALGAGVEDIANCACAAEYRIDFAASLRPGGPGSGAPTPPVVKTAAQLKQEARDYVLTNGRAQGIEHLTGYDSKTLKVYDPLSGHASGVKMSREMIDASKDPNNNIVFTHNHPKSRSLSGADLNVGGFAGVEGIWAYGHNGSTYYAEVSEKYTKSAYTRARNRIRKVYQESVNARDITPEDAGALFDHSIMLSLDNDGLIDYEYTLEGETLAAFERSKSFIAEVLGL